MVVSSLRVGVGKFATLAFLVLSAAAALILIYLILRQLFSPVVEDDVTNFAHLVKFGWLRGDSCWRISVLDSHDTRMS